MSCETERPLDEFARALAERKHSRRTVVKIGIGALAATMFPGVARAGVDGEQCRNRCLRGDPPNVCGRSGRRHSCGTSPEGNLCVCSLKNEGGCACFNPVCSDRACSTSTDCQNGWACVNSECCGGSVCAPRCRSAGGGGRKWT